MATDAEQTYPSPGAVADPAPAEASDELRDHVLHDEIQLVGQLVVVATSSSNRLSQAEIDRALGIEHSPERG